MLKQAGTATVHCAVHFHGWQKHSKHHTSQGAGAQNLEGAPLLPAAWGAAGLRGGRAAAEAHAFGRSVLPAAKEANAHGFISELPQGYDTHVTDRWVGGAGCRAVRMGL